MNMKKWGWVFAVPAVILPGVYFGGNFHANRKGAVEPSKAEVAQKVLKLQVPFIANDGQTDEKVRFYAQTFGGTVFVTKEGEIVYSLPNNSSDGETQCPESLMHLSSGMHNARCRIHNTRNMSNTTNRLLCILHHESNVPYCNNCLLAGLAKNTGQDTQGVAIKETLVGGKVCEMTGNEKAVTNVNYFKGNDPSKWKSNISTYDVVSFGEVYDGIELKLKAYGNNVEKLFCVKPGAKPDQIKIKLSGINPQKSPLEKGGRGLWVNVEGQLVAETKLGPVKFTKPIAYQEIDGKRVAVDVEYRIKEPEARSQIQDAGASGAGKHKTCNSKLMHTNAQSEFRNPQLETSDPKSAIQNLSSTEIGDLKLEYGFKVASYDKTKDLIIDPLLASTFLGGTERDGTYSVSAAIDKDGNVYVTGNTRSKDFPTTSAYQGNNAGDNDVFVSRFNGDLTKLLASTYLGGYYSDDYAYSVAIDNDGNIYVTGSTISDDFPTTNGAYDTSFNGSGSNDDVFVSRFNSDLTKLLASTFLGGPGTDEAYSMAIDGKGNVYVAGSAAIDFPTTSSAYDTSWNGMRDVFVSKFNSDLAKLLACTYLGGDSNDSAHSLAMDKEGNIYVVGDTYSDDFPTSSGAYDISFNGSGDDDVFVSRLNGDLTKLLASTFLGGTNYDVAYSAAIDKDGNIYVAGKTKSDEFPTTPDAYDPSHSVSNRELGNDVFVSRFDNDLTTLIASTYLEGGSEDIAHSVTIDKDGNVYVAGETESGDFPTTPGAYGTSHYSDNDVFVSRFNGDLTRLLASTYLGGTDIDKAYSTAIDKDGNIYVAGYTTSSDFPTTSGVYDTSYNYEENNVYGEGDIFVSRFDANLSYASATSTPTATPTPTPSQTCANDGDVNEDGKLTAKDALLAFEYVLGKTSLTSCQQSHADANGNGKVTAADALCIFNAVLNGSSPSETLSCK